MLRALGEDVVALRDAFPQDIDDISLFSQLRGPNLVFVSTDTSQMTREQEARALRQARITALFLGPFFSKMQLWPKAVWLITKWPKLRQFAESVNQGSCAEIKQNGAGAFFPL